MAPGIDPSPEQASVDGMAAYYVKRAAYYERVYFKPERQCDLRTMEAALAEPFAGRKVLEIACGTGWWAPHGAARAAHWRATDLNPETMAVARAKPGMPAHVRFQTVDAYSLAELGDEAFDAAFAGCWWSHVPLARLPGWLDALHARLTPGAVVVMLDNSFVQTSSTPISRSDAEGNTYQQRLLDDGSTHEVLKNFPKPEAAIAALGPRAQAARWTAHTHYWVLQYTLA
jgi:demethylmenaquinone methyltransferase/2-methoxy-6-polyprenyl-1,4-benzoquinol methylase